jgi:hypothetical protein
MVDGFLTGGRAIAAKRGPATWHVPCFTKGMKKTLALVALALLSVACDDATGPSARTTIVAGMNPTQSGVVSLSPTAYPYIVPGGVLLLPGSNLVKVDVTTTLDHAEPYAQLYVFLLTADGGYCGQNHPDAPEFFDLPAGFTERRTVTGFSVFRLPCEVTGVRAVLHRRRASTGLLGPPPPDQVIVETTVPAQLLIRQD